MRSPSFAACSMSNTRRPRNPAWAAHIIPAAPAPITITSKSTTQSNRAARGDPVRVERHKRIRYSSLEIAIRAARFLLVGHSAERRQGASVSSRRDALTTEFVIRESFEDLVDPAHTALVVIDVQNDLCSEDSRTIVPRLAPRISSSCFAAGASRPLSAPASPPTAASSTRPMPPLGSTTTSSLSKTASRQSAGLPPARTRPAAGVDARRCRGGPSDRRVALGRGGVRRDLAKKGEVRSARMAPGVGRAPA